MEERGSKKMKLEQNQLTTVDDLENSAKIVLHSPSDIKTTAVLLEGHSDPVYTVRFSPNGRYLASGSLDKNVFLWDIEDSDYKNHVFKGHKNAVMQVCWTSDSSSIISASIDKTVAIWDLETGCSKRRLRGHKSYINSCDSCKIGTNLICTGSDDGTIGIWDVREKDQINTISHKFQVLSVCFSNDTERIYAGTLDNQIQCWDLKTNKLEYVLKHHIDSVTSLRLNKDGSQLLSNSEDRTCRLFDVRHATQNKDRCIGLFQGHEFGYEKNLIRSTWAGDEKFVISGSSDSHLYIWEKHNQNLKYRLPGHSGCLNEVDYHPSKPLIVSGSSDRKIILGEIKL